MFNLTKLRFVKYTNCIRQRNYSRIQSERSSRLRTTWSAKPYRIPAGAGARTLSESLHEVELEDGSKPCRSLFESATSWSSNPSRVRYELEHEPFSNPPRAGARRSSEASTRPLRKDFTLGDHVVRGSVEPRWKPARGSSSKAPRTSSEHVPRPSWRPRSRPFSTAGTPR